MPERGDIEFRRVRLSVGDRVVWLDWDVHPDGKSPLPFTLWTVPGNEEGITIDWRIVTEPDVVGWRRAPDPAEGPESDAEGDSEGAEAAGPGPEEPK